MIRFLVMLVSAHRRGGLAGVWLIAISFALFGCSTTQTEVSARSRFAEYERVAILSHLSRVDEGYFLPKYMQAFPNQTVVERRDLIEVFREQDLEPDRLDPETRANLLQIFGVEGILYPSFGGDAKNSSNAEEGTEAKSGNDSQFSIKIIDTSTGEISAAVLIVPSNSWVSKGASRRKMMGDAIESLENKQNAIIAKSLRSRPTHSISATSRRRSSIEDNQ